MSRVTLLVVFGTLFMASCDNVLDCLSCDEMFHLASDTCRMRGEAIAGFVCTEDSWGCAKSAKYKCVDPETFPGL